MTLPRAVHAVRAEKVEVHRPMQPAASTPKESRVFFALSDATRRQLLDQLHARDGQRAAELGQNFEISRQAIGKHLDILEDVGLVAAQRSGRETVYYLNRVPILQVKAGWMGKFTEVAARIDCG